MLIYDLVCAQQHKFEAWFKSVDDYEQQRQSGMLCCPVCDEADVRKVPSASYISTGQSRQNTSSLTKPQNMQQAVELLRNYLETRSENVGGNFAEEARKIHYGEADQRNIHGTATVDEVVELHEEGVDVLPLPAALAEKKQLNS